MGVITEVEKQKYFAYLDGAADGLREGNKIVVEVLQEIRQEIETEYNKYRNMSDKWDERANGLGDALELIDKYIERNIQIEEHTNE